MALLLKGLEINIPRYKRRDSVVISSLIQQSADKDGQVKRKREQGEVSNQEGKGQAEQMVMIKISSPHGLECPMPMIQSAKIILSSIDIKEGQTIPFISDQPPQPSAAGSSQEGCKGSLVIRAPASMLCSVKNGDGSSSHTSALLEDVLGEIQIQIDLCSWADPDRRTVLLKHQLINGKCERNAQSQPSSNPIKKEAEEKEEEAKEADSLFGDGEWDTYLGRNSTSSIVRTATRGEGEEGDGLRDEGPFLPQIGLPSNEGWISRRYSFVTQVLQYNLDEVVENYEASPPQHASADNQGQCRGGLGSKGKAGGGKGRGRKRKASSDDEEGGHDDDDDDEDWQEDE